MEKLSYLYVSLNIISLAAIVAIITLTYGKRDKKGAKELLIVFSLIFIASISSFLESLYSDYSIKFLFRNISQIGYFLIPSSSFNFIMSYTRVKSRFIYYLRFILFIYAITCVLLIFTNNTHHIMRVSVELGGNGKLIITQTLIGKITVAFNTVISLSGLVALWIFLRKSLKGSRLQVLYIFIGFFIPILLTYTRSALSGLIGFPFPSSTSFLLGIIFILIGMFRYDFLSISPIARNWVLDEIEVGMVFIDNQNNVVDKNRFSNELPWSVEDIIKSYEPWTTLIGTKKDGEFELHISDRYYQIKVHSLKVGGSVSLIRDITRDVIKKQELTHKAERDSMTKILNRESFVTKVEKYLEGTENNSSLILIDIDHFKTINDTYGHMAGDYIIKSIVNIVKNSIRESDFFGRLGGDEFIIFVKDADRSSILNLTNRIEGSVREYSFIFNNIDINVTLSIGAQIAAKTTFNRLYELADEALYEAKETGRAKSVIHT